MAVLEDLSTRMKQILTQSQTHNPATTYDIDVAKNVIKLDGKDYALWPQTVKMHISGRDRF